MNPIAEFLASNVAHDERILLLLGAIAVVFVCLGIPYILATNWLKEKARRHFLNGFDNFNFTDEQRAQMVANKRYPLPKKYESSIVFCSVGFLFGSLGACLILMVTTIWPVLNSYTDCSRTVEGKIIVPGYEQETRDFTLCRQREYYGAEWSDWYVADRIYNDSPR